MRDPRRGVAGSAGWQRWGLEAAQALDEVLASQPPFLKVAERLGADLSPEEAQITGRYLASSGQAAAAALARKLGQPDAC